jgi:hypothetical protein
MQTMTKASTLVTTKQDLSRWTRALADAPGIPWAVEAGPGGTMVITELDVDRCALARPEMAAAQGAAS